MRAEFRDIDGYVLEVLDMDEPLPKRHSIPIRRTQNALKPRDVEVLEFERDLVDFTRNLVVYRRVK